MRRLAFAATSGTVAAAAYYDERVRRRIVIPVVGGTARVFVRGANNLTLHDEHHLHEALRRPAGTAMLSVSNHISTMDDPGMLAAIVPLGTLLDPDAMRWGVCASDVCFKPGSWIQRCASTAKVMPVRRGGGVWQAELDAIVAKLRAGDWVHYFPEGTIRQDGRIRMFRRGVGRLVAAVPEPGALVVLPFYHVGADKVQPTTQTAASVFSAPNLGTPIHVIFGACATEAPFAAHIRAVATRHHLTPAQTRPVHMQVRLSTSRASSRCATSRRLTSVPSCCTRRSPTRSRRRWGGSSSSSRDGWRGRMARQASGRKYTCAPATGGANSPQCACLAIAFMLSAASLMLSAAWGTPAAVSFAGANASSSEAVHGRSLVSQGCLDCCFGSNCVAGFNGMPGMCCGTLPNAGCCPMGASCVRCASHWKCTNSRMVTRASKCSICADDQPTDCYGMSYGHTSYHHGSSLGSSMMSMIFFVVLICAIGSCFYNQRGQPYIVEGVPAGGVRHASNKQGLGLAEREAGPEGSSKVAPHLHR